MEENVALDSSKQKKFVKSIRGIKKLIKQKNESEKLPSTDKVKEGRVTKKRKDRKERGLVYLSHIPHGFYEHEMSQYFKQFGLVTNVRVIRSKRTGNSKGFAFVEFSEPSVAQIVADTMNNYLMGKRLLKAAYIPPEKQRRAKRMHWSTTNNPGHDSRIKMKKAHNAHRDEKGEMKRVKKILSNLAKTKKKLQELGINYDFFTPVDMPEELKNKVDTKDDSEKENTSAKRSKKEKVVVIKEKENKKVKVENKVAGKNTVVQKKDEPEKPVKATKVKPKKNSAEASDKQIKEQKQKMIKKGVTPLEEFINVKQESGSDNDSDNSAFDSDEFEKMMQNDDEFDSNEDSEQSGEQSDDSGEGDEEDVPPKIQIKSKGKSIPAISQKLSAHKRKEIVKPQKKAAGQKLASAPQKKFEKQTSQKPRNKQFKKKK